MPLSEINKHEKDPKACYYLNFEDTPINNDTTMNSLGFFLFQTKF